MTTLLSWNIQNGLGVDGTLSLQRIAERIQKISDPDVICLQEVSVNTLLPDGSRDDQVSDLAALFPHHTPHFGAAIDRLCTETGKRALYGNLILSRLPVLAVFHHPLPQPAERDLKQMPRQMIEVTVQTSKTPLRIVTTHLEFHSEQHRLAQTERILALNKEVMAQSDLPPRFEPAGPYSPIVRPSDCIVCGDFNFAVGSKEYDSFTKAGFRDAWQLRSPGRRPCADLRNFRCETMAPRPA